MALDATICLNQRAEEIAVDIFFDIRRVCNSGRTAIICIVVLVPVTRSQVIRTRKDTAFGISFAIPVERIGIKLRYRRNDRRNNRRIGRQNDRCIDNRGIGPRWNHCIGRTLDRPDTGYTEVTDRTRIAIKLQFNSISVSKDITQFGNLAPAILLEA